MDFSEGSAIPFRTLHHTVESHRELAVVGLYLIPDEHVADTWDFLDGGRTPRTAPTVDLVTETVILFTHGHRPTPGHGVTIDRVVLEDGQLLVEATETRSTGGFDSAVWPAHMIAVKGKWPPYGDIRLRLQVTYGPQKASA
jgi:hypothetical protein